MNNPIIKALYEAIKEAIRITLFFGISTLLDILLAKLTSLPQNGTVVVFLTLLLRLVDKYWHTYNKNSFPDRKGESLGILRF